MKLIFLLIFLVVITNTYAFDYFLFVELWPATWIHNSKITYNFSNNFFGIHGIWGEYYNGSYPEFCSNSSTHFNVSALSSIKNNLTQYWTDFNNATKFWEHEFLKHFTCVTDTFPYPYKLFWIGLYLRQKFNVYNALNASNIIPNNIHKPMHISYFVNALKKYYGKNVIVACERDTSGRSYLLSEVRLCFTKHFELFDCPTLLQNREACSANKITYYKL